jgi:hypothetical protein
MLASLVAFNYESEFHFNNISAPSILRFQRDYAVRIFVASLVVLAVLYVWDQGYNNGKLLDGLESMRRSIAHNMFP